MPMLTSMVPAMSLPEEISGLAKGHSFLQLSLSSGAWAGTGPWHQDSPMALAPG